jgi:hypothetical protein
MFAVATKALLDGSFIEVKQCQSWLAVGRVNH